MENDSVEVEVVDNRQLLRLQNVINCMKTMVYETMDHRADHVFPIPYSRGKNVGFCFRNGTGRSVNLICGHVGYTLEAFFGETKSLNEEGIKEDSEHITREFGEDYIGCARAVMDYLVYGIIAPLE